MISFLAASKVAVHSEHLSKGVSSLVRSDKQAVISAGLGEYLLR